MILRNMITRFQSRLDEGSAAYWNDERAKGLANTVKDKLVAEFGIITQQYYTFNSVQGQQDYQVPSTFISSHYLYYNSSYNQEITIVNSPRDIYGPNADVTQEGWPTKGYIWSMSGRRQLTIYPTFNDDDIEMKWWFWGTPPELSGDNDEPNLPPEWHPSMVEAMVNQAKEDDKLISVGDNLVLWKDIVRTLKKLDSTKAGIERGGQYGSVEGSFGRINTPDGQANSQDYFNLVGRTGTTGAIW